MLDIIRKYTLIVDEKRSGDIVRTLKNYGVTIDLIDYSVTKVAGYSYVDTHISCKSNDVILERLIDYLQTTFRGKATIIY